MTEFQEHSGPIMDVEFHPHEFLLASASKDRTVNFWDLESFALVSTTEKDSGPVRLGRSSLGSLSTDLWRYAMQWQSIRDKKRKRKKETDLLAKNWHQLKLCNKFPPTQWAPILATGIGDDAQLSAKKMGLAQFILWPRCS